MKHPKSYSLPASPSSSSSAPLWPTLHSEASAKRDPSQKQNPRESGDTGSRREGPEKNSKTPPSAKAGAHSSRVATTPTQSGPSNHSTPSRSFTPSQSLVPLTERPQFVELLARSNFSFLQGASHPEEMVLTAKRLGYQGLAICDVNGLYGVVRGFQAIKRPSLFDAEQLEHTNEDGSPKEDFHYMCGTELTPYDCPPVILLPMNKDGYTRLCHLITKSKRRAPKGQIVLSFKDICDNSDDLIIFPLPPWDEKQLTKLKDVFGDRIYLPVWRDFTWESIRFAREAFRLEQSLGITLFATQRPLFHEPDRKPLHDVLTCILHKTTLDESATRLSLNRERHLKSPADLAVLFRDRPDLLARTMDIAKRVTFSLSELKYKYPREHLPGGKTATEYLRDLVEEGLQSRYGYGIENFKRNGKNRNRSHATDYDPSKSLDLMSPDERNEFLQSVRNQVEHELELITKMEYEDYFLTLQDICQFAKRAGILYQGRGSAANSIVCFAIRLTNIDPIRLGLLFERFISENRKEPPDIDIDFEHEHREHVIQYIYKKYGERRAAMVCTVICYRSRMAVREVAKAMGVPLNKVDALIKYMGREGLSRLLENSSERSPTAEAKTPPPAKAPRNPREGSEKVDLGYKKELFDPSSRSPIDTRERRPLPANAPRLDLQSLNLNEFQFHLLLKLSVELQGFPRHLGIHSGGFVISHEPIVDLVPVESATKDQRYVVQWNKDDIDTLKMMKVDILALGMLAAIQRSLQLLKKHKEIDWDLSQIPQNDEPTYQMIQKAETIGVFQIESRAQMSLLPRLKPKNFYDLVIQIAIVRPGPIQGGMVHPFLRRRAGQEKITYAHDILKPTLEKTLGIPLFQEQVMQIAVDAANFTPGEADELRRVVSSAWKKKAVMHGLRLRVINGMLKNNIPQSYAEQIYQTIEGFASYGFPESHSASFALLAYASCFFKKHYPDVFCCALLNSQPMGFYSPRQLIADAQRNGVHFRPLDVQHSVLEATLEERDVEFIGKASRINPWTPLPKHHAVRIGFNSVYGLRPEFVEKIVDERKKNGPYLDLHDVVRRTKLPRAAMVRLGAAGAFESIGISARESIWSIQAINFDENSLFFGEHSGLDESRLADEVRELPQEDDWQTVHREYQTKGFSIDTHPLAIVRPELDEVSRNSRSRFTIARDIPKLRHRAPIRVAGLLSLVQKPPTAKGMCFLSLEDETGLMNVVITPDLYQVCRMTLMREPLIEVEGIIESFNGVYNVRARKVKPLSQTVGEHRRQIRGANPLFSAY